MFEQKRLKKVPEKFDLDRFTRISDILFFNRPLVSHLSDSNGDTYLYNWVDHDNDYDYHILFRVEPNDLERYLDRKKTMRDLLVNPVNDLIYLIKTEIATGIEEYSMLFAQDFPSEYLPQNDSYLPEGYEVEAVHVTSNNRYRLLIKKDWAIDDFVRLPRLYEQVYAFFHNMLGDYLPRSDDIEYTFRSQPWRGGWSAVNFFNNMVRLVISPKGLEIASLRYASPGWIEFVVAIDTARYMSNILHDFPSPQIKQEYDEIYDFLRDQKILRKDTRTSTQSLSAKQTKQIDDRLHRFAKNIFRDETSLEMILQSTASSYQALKIMLSLYRKLRDLSRYEQRGMVDF